jgi:hypothetical protein
MCYKIYKISSDYSSKLYIGQTKRSLEERFREHCRQDSLIGRAIKKRSRSHFKIELLEELSEHITDLEVNLIENKYISEYKTLHPNGYNLFCKKIFNITNSNHTHYEGKKYECFSLVKDKNSFCVYNLIDFKNHLNIKLDLRTLYHHVNNGNSIAGYSVERLNHKIRKKKINYQRFVLISPDNISFCVYGVAHLKKEFNVNPTFLYPLMNPNHKRYNCTHRGWKIKRLADFKIFDKDKKEKGHTIDTKEKIRQASIRMWADPEKRKQLSESIKGSFSEETLNKKAEFKKQQWEDPEYRQKMTNMSKALWESEEHKQKLKEIHASEDYRKQMSESQKKRLSNYDNRNKICYKYHLIPPNEEPEFCSYGLEHICKEYGLSAGNLSEVIKGKRKQHKGWKVFKIE